MAAYFQLTRIGEGRPSTFHKIDEEMREYFGAKQDDSNWYKDWYNSIGLGLAMGNSFDEIIAIYKKCEEKNMAKGDEKGAEGFREIAAAAEWLKENYTADTWRGR